MRPQLTGKDIRTAASTIRYRAFERLDEKGKGIFVSSHEIFGILAEEQHELLHAICENNVGAIMSELEDIAVAALIGLASVKSLLEEKQA